ncbi:uncharacterized protein LOC142795311 [Rhipicephalus microplus]|uniref:uncharacterized protein LOC142795311 n=1 Tax=Rhipicephalus microplus TaxID=6941 RepID=UPI003F6BD34E
MTKRLGNSQGETIRKIKTAFGDDAMSSTQIKEWYNRFKDGRTSVEKYLAMKRVAAKFLPKLLTVEQKQVHVEVSQDTLHFINTIITGDKSRVYRYDPETKSQWSQWKHSASPMPKKARKVRSDVNMMLSAFFDSRGVVHHEYAPQGQMITEYYRNVLYRLHDAVRCKRPELWSTGNWHIHHDNALAHSSHLLEIFFENSRTPVVQQAPYSP